MPIQIKSSNVCILNFSFKWFCVIFLMNRRRGEPLSDAWSVSSHEQSQSVSINTIQITL